MGIIYMATSKTTGKSYIGQTSRSLSIRKTEHSREKKSNSLFHNAIRKYGADDFIWQIITTVPNEELDFHEKFYIKCFNTHVSFGGYNLDHSPPLRGVGRGWKMSEATKKKIATAKKGKRRGIFTDQMRLNMSLASTCAKKILCINNNTIYRSQQHAARELGIRQPHVCQVLKGKRNCVSGYRFRYVKEGVDAFS